jgi:ubiquitin C-terminal hydrolase
MEEMIFKESNELKQKYFKEGPFVYELYGIMLHKGGAFGGHYSAYIKDLEINNLNENVYEDKWYHFNDSFVNKISVT